MGNDLQTSAASLIRAQFAAHLETVQASLNVLVPMIAETGEVIAGRLISGGKLLAFGNGGSAAQADHLASELIGRYNQTRRPFPALSLSSSPGAVTCIGNDFSFEFIFERQVEALAGKNDIVVGLTTSGSSRNVLRGLQAGREAGAVTIMLTGGGITDAPSNYILSIPSTSTARIQEVHLIIIHAWCELIDRPRTTASVNSRLPRTPSSE